MSDQNRSQVPFEPLAGEIDSSALGQTSYGQDDAWRLDWAGESVDRSTTPLGRLRQVVSFEDSDIFARGEAQKSESHFPIHFGEPRLRIISSMGKQGALIASEGAEFGLFSASRQGWKRLSFPIQTGLLANCTGLRFSVRSNESYEALPLFLGEAPRGGEIAGPGGVVRYYIAKIDIVGDDQWHEIVLPFYGDRFSADIFRAARQLDAARVNRIDFVLPYHRPFSFAISGIDTFEAEPGDIQLPTVYPITEVADSYTDFGGTHVQRTDIPELGVYEELAFSYQSFYDTSDFAAHSREVAVQAQAELRQYIETFKQKNQQSAQTYSYIRAIGLLTNVLWANQVEIDRLAHWQLHPDGTIAHMTPFAPEQYRDYPVELSYISYWSEGLRISGIVARPTRTWGQRLLALKKGEAKTADPRYPLVALNHGSVTFAKDNLIQLLRFASSGYAVFASDYRGQGESEGRQTRNLDGIPSLARDVMNGMRAVFTMPFVDSSRVGIWGHSLGGAVGWQILTSEMGESIRAFVQVSAGISLASGSISLADEELLKIKAKLFLTAGGNEPRALRVLTRSAERLRNLGLDFETKTYPGYSHHGMKFQESLRDSITFIRKTLESSE